VEDGVAVGGTFEAVGEEDFEWLFEIDFWGVVRMTRAFLPLFEKSDDARLVNLSSVCEPMSPPGPTAYSASEFAVRGFSNSLRHELAGSKVGVTVAYPGGVATSIAENARAAQSMPPEEVAQRKAIAKKALRMPSAAAGQIVVKGIERRSVRVLVGDDAKFLAFLERVAPISYWKIFSQLIASSELLYGTLAETSRGPSLFANRVRDGAVARPAWKAVLFLREPKLRNYQRILRFLYKANFSSQVITGILSHTAGAMIWRSNGSAWCGGRPKR
jgi:short chain dehydrogenase